ncbi:MAG: hypothetical protein ACFFEJ_18820 [Candidatus Thorarchaeota archaeon]
MISDAKPQNLIIVITMIAGIISGIGLVNSASYYGGSYTMIRYLDINLVDVAVSNLDPDNITQNPGLSMVFNVYAPPGAPGDAEITYLTAEVYVNGDKINYATFRRDIPLALRSLYPEYNQTFAIGSTILQDLDKQVLIDAYNSEEWVISIQLTLFYNVFEAVGESVRIIAYSWNTQPSGLPS